MTSKSIRIPPQSGTALLLRSGQLLRVTCGEQPQVADLVAFNGVDPGERLSAGRTIDYQSSTRISTGGLLWSNRSTPLLRVETDTVGIHDLLLSPCSQEMFEHLHGATGPHPSCFGNLVGALAPHNVDADLIDTTFNIFMRVDVGPAGEVTIGPPASDVGDYIELRAMIDLVVGVTACSAEQTNAGRFGPIDLLVD